jgi:hypothetical protein
MVPHLPTPGAAIRKPICQRSSERSPSTKKKRSRRPNLGALRRLAKASCRWCLCIIPFSVSPKHAALTRFSGVLQSRPTRPRCPAGNRGEPPDALRQFGFGLRLIDDFQPVGRPGPPASRKVLETPDPLVRCAPDLTGANPRREPPNSHARHFTRRGGRLDSTPVHQENYEMLLACSSFTRVA